MDLKIPPQFVSIDDALSSLFGNGVKIKNATRVLGGDINEAYKLELTDGTHIFMKSNTKKDASFFSAEAAGLAAIAQTDAIGTPHIFCTGVDEKKHGSSFLLLEYIQGGKRISGYWRIFANQLSAMHKADASFFIKDKKYGFLCDNYIGSRKQINTTYNTWIDFFRDCRLEPQVRCAADYFEMSDLKKICKLLDHLDNFLVEPMHPSLLHGDLWSGNVIMGNDGKAWLIDPAVSVGHAEAEIAMTELFGGFPQEFYDVYRETGLLLPGYSRRKNLYNLYHLLNHLNIFGRCYLSAVKHIVEEYMP